MPTLRPKTLKIYDPERLLSMATAQAEVRFDAAANILQNQIKNNLRSIIRAEHNRPVTKQSRPGSKYDVSGVWWTVRDAGELLHSVRVVKQHKSNGEPSIWVMVGNKKAYWAAMFEYSKGNAKGYRGRPYWRPAIATSKPKMTEIWEKGV